MTCANVDSRAGSVSDRSSRRTHRKAVLFCPRCGHESPVDGDWELTLRPEVVDVHCPECRERLARRPVDWSAAKERSSRNR